MHARTRLRSYSARTTTSTTRCSPAPRLYARRRLASWRPCQPACPCFFFQFARARQRRRPEARLVPARLAVKIAALEGVSLRERGEGVYDACENKTRGALTLLLYFKEESSPLWGRSADCAPTDDCGSAWARGSSAES